MKRKNFTLIEILGVCALIAILGIIGFGSYTFAMNKSKDSATRALLKQVEAGLANVKQECGYYPKSALNKSNAELLSDLNLVEEDDEENSKDDDDDLSNEFEVLVESVEEEDEE